MNSDPHALLILESIPASNQYDRLYIQGDGLISVDMYHRYTGCLGRSCMHQVSGGHSRQTILHAIETLLCELTRIAHECTENLCAPYTIGNFRCYGLETDATKYYKSQVGRLVNGLHKLRALIATLQLVYIGDTHTAGLLRDSIDRLQTIEFVVQPVLHLLLDHQN